MNIKMTVLLIAGSFALVAASANLLAGDKVEGLLFLNLAGIFGLAMQRERS